MIQGVSMRRTLQRNCIDHKGSQDRHVLVHRARVKIDEEHHCATNSTLSSHWRQFFTLAEASMADCRLVWVSTSENGPPWMGVSATILKDCVVGMMSCIWRPSGPGSK